MHKEGGALNHRIIFCCLCIGSIVGASSLALSADFSTHGYYRMRSVVSNDLDLQNTNSALPHSNSRFGLIAYNQMRLRLEPTLTVNDRIVIRSEFDILDNLLFGTNETRQLNINVPVVGTLNFPAGAGSFRQTGTTAGENGSINVRAVWTDILAPIGLFRIGRQPSHWGLGIFQNDGRGRQGDFGDIVDRILYLAQRPVSGGSLSAGVLFDIPFEAQIDPRARGLDTAVRSNAQDTYQVAALALYEEQLYSAGLFGGYRYRNGPEGATTMNVTDALGTQVASGIDGNTGLYFGDLYGRVEFQQYRFQMEGIYIGGKVTTGLAVDGIAFQGIGAANAANPCGSGGIICMPANQPIQVAMAAFEADAEYAFGGEWNVKSGFAQGDGNVLSSKITQLGFRPDYQVALMMFNFPLGSSPSFFDSTSGAQLAGGVPTTGNNINNALYVSAGYKHRLDLEHVLPGVNWLKVGTQATTAWAHKRNVNLDFAALTGTANLPVIVETANTTFKRWYGVEVDLSMEAAFFDEHLFVFMEGGALLPGRAYDIEVGLTNPGSIVDPVPNDGANIGWMARLTTMVEF